MKVNITVWQRETEKKNNMPAILDFQRDDNDIPSIVKTTMTWMSGASWEAMYDTVADLAGQVIRVENKMFDLAFSLLNLGVEDSQERIDALEASERDVLMYILQTKGLHEAVQAVLETGVLPTQENHDNRVKGSYFLTDRRAE